MKKQKGDNKMFMDCDWDPDVDGKYECDLGNNYYYGVDKKKDWEEAKIHYGRAIELGDNRAKLNYSNLILISLDEKEKHRINVGILELERAFQYIADLFVIGAMDGIELILDYKDYYSAETIQIMSNVFRCSGIIVDYEKLRAMLGPNQSDKAVIDYFIELKKESENLIVFKEKRKQLADDLVKTYHNNAVNKEDRESFERIVCLREYSALSQVSIAIIGMSVYVLNREVGYFVSNLVDGMNQDYLEIKKHWGGRFVSNNRAYAVCPCEELYCEYCNNINKVPKVHLNDGEIRKFLIDYYPIRGVPESDYEGPNTLPVS